MRSTLLLALNGLVLAQTQAQAQAVPAPAADGRYTITADGIKAQFIPYGATLTNLWVKDRSGTDTDVVLGYDDAAYYRKFSFLASLVFGPRFTRRVVVDVCRSSRLRRSLLIIATHHRHSQRPRPPRLQLHPRPLRVPHRQCHLHAGQHHVRHRKE